MISDQHRIKPATRIRELRKAQGITLKQLACAIGTTPQTAQRLEVGTMTVSLEWLHAIATALAVPPSKLVVDPESEELTGKDDLLERLRNELIRTRRTVPSFDDAPLALFHAAGDLARTLLEWQQGLRRQDELVTACAATAAAAMRIAVDAGPTPERAEHAPTEPVKLVINRS
jgi:transcriptional regulator with XRE-family HTH domain